MECDSSPPLFGSHFLNPHPLPRPRTNPPGAPSLLHPRGPPPCHQGSSRQIKPPEVQKTKKHSEHSPPCVSHKAFRRCRHRSSLPSASTGYSAQPAGGKSSLSTSSPSTPLGSIGPRANSRGRGNLPPRSRPPAHPHPDSLNVRQPAKKAAPARARPAGLPLPTSEAQPVSVRFAPNAPTSAHPRPARN